MKRLIFDIILFLSVLVFPWWISAPLMFIGIFLFKNFYEFIISCVVIYVIYSHPNGSMISSPVFFALFTMSLYLTTQVIRKNIIFYKK